jgi:hypothetical protein
MKYSVSGGGWFVADLIVIYGRHTNYVVMILRIALAKDAIGLYTAHVGSY